MKTKHSQDNLNDVDDYEDLRYMPWIRNVPVKEQRQGGKKPKFKLMKPHPQEIEIQLSAQDDGQKDFIFSYHPSHHERQWIVESLGGFNEGHWLDDVLRLVKGGKEANVYQCLAHPSVDGLSQPYIAAKVYRPRLFRNLKNDHVYRQGRAYLDSDGHLITNKGMLHAIHTRSKYGLELMHSSWIEHEFQALLKLHREGADVPMPLERGSNAILMAFIGDKDTSAPTLNSVDLDVNEAKALFNRVLRNIEIMLAIDLIHGDLSAYNILYWQGEITLIDLPQVVDPKINRQAYQIFQRDVTRICEYFRRQGVSTIPNRLADDLWSASGLAWQNYFPEEGFPTDVRHF